MLIRTPAGWEIAESRATPEDAVRRRRGIGRRGLIGGGISLALAARAEARDYPPGRGVTPKSSVTSYNNFYEFGEDKDIAEVAQALKTTPWTLSIDGLVDHPLTLDPDQLAKMMPVEQRTLRHRCVEAWAMTVPWTGFPLAALVAKVSPKPAARYLRFTSAEQDSMPGISSPLYPWPYREGITLAEATNDLAFLATGMYGGPLMKQDGAPIRLLLPWKYGFKSAKSLTRITFTDQQPETFWQSLGPNEYGFWANVDPDVPHPRWTQSSERLLGSGERVPTQIFNGYGEWVAGLYKGGAFAQMSPQVLFR